MKKRHEPLRTAERGATEDSLKFDHDTGIWGGGKREGRVLRIKKTRAGGNEYHQPKHCGKREKTVVAAK